MGTNYYAKRDYCHECARYDETKTLHVGKSSGGWTFSFQAYRILFKEFLEKDILSYRDWLDYLRDPKVDIYDEYGEKMSKNNFKQKVEKKQKEKNNHSDFVHKDYLMSEEQKKSCWKDAEGHSFSEWEFS